MVGGNYSGAGMAGRHVRIPRVYMHMPLNYPEIVCIRKNRGSTRKYRMAGYFNHRTVPLCRRYVFNFAADEPIASMESSLTEQRSTQKHHHFPCLCACEYVVIIV
jgi:hypothetical protein